MPIRNPKYLDQELLQNAADYYEISYDVETQIVETGKTTSSLGGKLKLGIANLGVEGGGEGSDSSEYQSTYAMPAKPLRMMNDVIDQTSNKGHVKTCSDFEEGISKGDLVELDGFLKLSAASEVGNIMSKFLPAVASAGGKLPEAQQMAMFADMFAGSSAPSRQLYELEPESDSEIRVFLAIEADQFFRSNGFEDIESDVSVFGTVERLVGENASMSLERWLLPDMDRSMRRMMKKQGLDKMLEGITGMVSVDLEDAKAVKGPAMEIRVMAVY